MNLNKFKIDFYKYFNIIMIINALIILTGLILFLTVGFNLSVDYAGGGIFMFGALATIVSLVIILIYVGIRYGWTKAISFVFTTLINALIYTSFVLIFRIEVADGFIMSLLLTIILSALNQLFLLDLEKEEYVNNAKVTNTQIKKNINKILIVYAIALFLSFVMFVVPTISALDLFRTMLISNVVCFYSALFITIPLYLFLLKRMSNLPKRKKVVEETDKKEETIN